MLVERTDMGGYTLIENAPLVARNTLRVAARAKLLAEIRDATKLPELLDFPTIRAGRLFVLGEGSNILLTGDIDGTVLAMETRGVHVEQDGDVARIAVAAGERWDDFVRWTLGQGFAGLENLILIPGTVGAAPIQNIGAYGTEVAEFIESVEAWDLNERRHLRPRCMRICVSGFAVQARTRTIHRHRRTFRPASQPCIATGLRRHSRRAGAHGCG
jgi:UDP-N-acetylmuramate dehydrogenase